MNFDFGLYPVITEEFCNDRSIFKILESVIAGGAKIVQLRQKNILKKDLYDQALIFKKITRENNVKLIINDHLDIALAVEADGVHLGQDDLPCKAARSIAPHFIIGVSTHNQDEIIKAEIDGATYVNIGPIFPTNTKTLKINALGLKYLEEVKVNIPFTVMGGIKKDNIVEVLKRGAKNIAMVTELTMADDVKFKTEEIIKVINDFTGE